MTKQKKKRSRSKQSLSKRRKQTVPKPNKKTKQQSFRQQYDSLDKCITQWMKQHGLLFLQVSLGTIFIWFGLLKPLGMSPASALVARTVYWVDPSWFVPFLGWWEVVIGLCLLWRPLIRVGVFLMALQMAGTFLPLVLLPHITWVSPFVLTLEGQYIIKNLVLIGAAIVIGSHVRDKKYRLL